MNLGSLLEKTGVRKGQRMLGLFPNDRPKKCCPFPRCQGKEPSARGEGRDARMLAGWKAGKEQRHTGYTHGWGFSRRFSTGLALYIWLALARVILWRLFFFLFFLTLTFVWICSLQVQSQHSAANLLQYLRPMWLACSLIILRSLH